MDYLSDSSKNRLSVATWSDLTEQQPIETKTLIERLYEEDDPEKNGYLSEDQFRFAENGYLILRNFMPHDLIEEYVSLRSKLPLDKNKPNNFFGGWNFPTPYMVYEELKNIALQGDLMNKMRELIGHEMGLHLCLTGWVSTERNFHQDTYLNPPFLWSNYAAVWIALDDIDEDSGPFQFVPGSHRWETMKQDKLFSMLTEEERKSAHWPTFTQDDVARVCEEEIAARGAKVSQFVPKKGDVLIWHSNLVHRGSEPKNKDLLRKSLICHYSALEKRLDMPRHKAHRNGKFFFELPVSGHIRPPM